MKRSICPGCGQPSDGGLCDACTLSSVKLLECPSRLEVTVCSVCGNVLDKNQWHISDKSIEEIIYDAVRSSVSVYSKIENPTIEVGLVQRGATRYLADVELFGRYGELEAHGHCQIYVVVILQACDRCSKMAGKYFEGTVQFRGNVGMPSKEQLDEAANIAQNLTDTGYRKGDSLSFIQEIKDVKGGLDIVVGSTQLGRQIAKTFQKKFGGTLQETRKLAGCKDGRDIYRTTILVRLPKLKEGDVIKFRGDISEVIKFDIKRAALKSLKDGRMTYLNLDESEDAEILGNRVDAKSTVVTFADILGVEILDPETYQTVFAMKPSHRAIVAGREVLALRTADGFVLLE